MTTRLVVDGNNLMHKIDDIARRMARDYDGARELLVRRLGDFRAGRRVSVTVVFDGKAGGFVQQVGSGVRAVFCRPGRSADDEIKALVARDPRPRSWTVVTSDNAIIRHVRDYGAETMKSEDFIALLAERKPGPGRPPTPEKPEMGPGDAAEWEAWFVSKKPDFGQPRQRPAPRRRIRHKPGRAQP